MDNRLDGRAELRLPTKQNQEACKLHFCLEKKKKELHVILLLVTIETSFSVGRADSNSIVSKWAICQFQLPVDIQSYCRAELRLPIKKNQEAGELVTFLF